MISAFCLNSFSAHAQDAASAGVVDKGKIFLTTSTYGVMAGSLVGLASLTFYRKPSKRLRNVAIGASLGLYTGLLLGAYMVYVVPDASRPRSTEPGPSAPRLDSDDPLNLGGGEAAEPQGRIVTPNFVPVAVYDGEAVLLGFDYKF